MAITTTPPLLLLNLPACSFLCIHIWPWNLSSNGLSFRTFQSLFGNLPCNILNPNFFIPTNRFLFCSSRFTVVVSFYISSCYWDSRLMDKFFQVFCTQEQTTFCSNVFFHHFCNLILLLVLNLHSRPCPPPPVIGTTIRRPRVQRTSLFLFPRLIPPLFQENPIPKDGL